MPSPDWTGHTSQAGRQKHAGQARSPWLEFLAHKDRLAHIQPARLIEGSAENAGLSAVCAGAVQFCCILICAHQKAFIWP